MPLFEFVTRAAFGVASVVLMLLACGLILYAVGGVWTSYGVPDRDVGAALLDAVGFTVIAIAVFDVGKYLLEEEAIRGREMRNAAEARRSLTKFISTIVIAVLLEAVVTTFQAGKDDVALMLYPTLLLLVGVLLFVGLGLYQRLSISVEDDADDPDEEDEGDGEGDGEGEARDEAARRTRGRPGNRSRPPARRS